MSRSVKVIIWLMLAIIFASAGFIGGYLFGFANDKPLSLVSRPSSAEGVGAAVDEVAELLRDQALDPPNETSATAGAIQGLLDSNGDEYALYFDERHFQYFNEQTMGAFGGIGVVLGEKEGTAYIVEVYEDTPAEKAGIKSGDQFVEIDGIRREKWTSDEVVKRVRGKEGTTVTIVMERPGKDGKPGEEHIFKLERAMIELPNLESELKGTVGYIQLAQFNQNSSTEIAGAVKELEKKGAKSFVLDLRNNPGGLLREAVDVASLFIKSGVIVQVEERDGEPEKSHAVGNQVTDAPLVVLVNANSASASEIVAGALQDHGRAELVGEKTFGKGSVQTVEQLSSGGAIKFTIAHYLTPKGRAIDGKGLEPDVRVKMAIEKQMDPETDTQLKKALELAK